VSFESDTDGLCTRGLTHHCCVTIVVERPYRIPVPDRAAFLVTIPPTLGILFVFLVSNWYTYLFSGLSVIVGLTIVKVGKEVNYCGKARGRGVEDEIESVPSSPLVLS
jgi:hypothetical protein